MQTRSKSLNYFKQNLEFKIDFDEASKEWKLNKKYVGNGCYQYKCDKIHKNGNNCKNKCLSGENFCKIHLNLSKFTNTHS